jgi:magnesium transporter
MISVYCPMPSGEGRGLVRRELDPDGEIPAEAIWIDLLRPTPEEDRRVEAVLGISIPTREEMSDIEPSEILYAEEGARYMTARVLCQSETEEPRVVPVSFILTEKALVTVRYDEPRSSPRGSASPPLASTSPRPRSTG